VTQRRPFDGYICRGKTVEEMRQERAAREAEAAEPCTFTLTRRQHRECEVAASNVEYLLSGAGNIFDLFHTGLSSGCIDPEAPGFHAMLEMLGRGYRAAADDEGDKLGKLGMLLRDQSPNRLQEDDE